jgi:hypothetical protein
MFNNSFMKESFGSDLKKEISNQVMNIDSFNIDPVESIKTMNSLNSSISEEDDDVNSETTEATSAGGGSGQYSQPLFSTTKKEMEEGDLIKGGLSSGKTLKDLSKKHSDKNSKGSFGKMYKHLQNQLKKGVKVEMEHTNDESIAKEISMDHLFEDPNYYTKLKKVEATEATSSDSSGQYSTPAFVAKDSKNWRTNKKTQIPGGKFVKIKDKCKKFPYCNQGDINALKIFENKSVKKVIKIICKKYDVSENVVKSIIVHEYESKILNKQNMKHLQLFEDFVNKAKSINEATQNFQIQLTGHI